MHRLAVACTAIVVLAGCSNALQSQPPLTQGPSLAAQPASQPKPGPNHSTLLYVSSSASDFVPMYNFKNGVVGSVYGVIPLANAGGMCANKGGNVWITTTDGTVAEYAHGSESPIRVMGGGPGVPYACAVDPSSGNVAVSYDRPNTAGGTIGTIQIFGKGNKGRTFGGFAHAWFLAYDNKGNLFIDGAPCGTGGCNSGGPPGIFELTKRGQTFQQLNVQGATLTQPTGIVWVNPTLLVADSENGTQEPVAYKVLVRASNATVVGTLPFSSAVTVGGLTVRAGFIVVPDTEGNSLLTYDLMGTLVSGFSSSSPLSVVVSQ
jgi:hypothetical protein